MIRKTSTYNSNKIWRDFKIGCCNFFNSIFSFSSTLFYRFLISVRMYKYELYMIIVHVGSAITHWYWLKVSLDRFCSLGEVNKLSCISAIDFTPTIWRHFFRANPE